jgi:hypothetical protein
MKTFGARIKRSLLPEGDLLIENSSGLIHALNSSEVISL